MKHSLFAVWLMSLILTRLEAKEPMIFESASTPTTLVELFSSEGCSSCPPAEAWLSRFKTQPDLWKKNVPVVFHVDYWDGLGWPDRFAAKTYTQRQHAYHQAGNTSSVYTPGFVVNGQEWKGWFQGQSLPSPDTSSAGRLRVVIADQSQAVVTFTPTKTISGPVQIYLTLLGVNLESQVTRGENQGQRLWHDFVVLHLQTQPWSSDQTPSNFSLPVDQFSQASALAVWAQRSDTLEVLQATGGMIK
jgi:hypothetical protein